jgi:lysophospholipid acyltransferase (LPLAT)-like uncharacterized protein
VAQPGAVWLAKVTGSPVVPFHIEADRFWSLNSWDRTQIPRPWATVAIAVGAPMFVGGDADELGIERARVELEQRLFGLETDAATLLVRADAPQRESWTRQ